MRKLPSVLARLPRRIAGVALAFALMVAGGAYAGYTLPLVIGSAPFGCTLVSGTTYNCPASITLTNNDSVAATSNLTLIVNGNVTIPNNVTWGDSSFKINIVATGTVTLGNSNNTDVFGDITAATIVMGNNAQVFGSCMANSTFTNSSNCTSSSVNGCVTSAVGADTLLTCTANGRVIIPAAISSVRYLVVGGGGGGGGIPSGNVSGGGGGGAGGVRSAASFSVTAGTSYAVVVGAGGSAGTATVQGGTGADSTFSTVTAKGGGGGASANVTAGTAGGSGGGGRTSGAGGAGTAGQGNAGATGPSGAGGGGGGAGAAGSSGSGSTGGDGGIGLANDITGTSTYYGGGGGGGAGCSLLCGGGSGGNGGGGSAPDVRGAGGSGTTNRGGGGAGATGAALLGGSAYSGGAGGSGIVIIRYGTSASGLDHYELSAPTSSIACLPSTITVTACANSTSPCSSAYTTSMSGKTATLATSAGTLGSTTVTFNASGVATTTLSYPAASNGTAVTVTLSGEQTAAANSRKCCADGTSCSVSNSCSSTFNTAGFIVSAATNGAAATIPTGTAGVSSATYYLRAVQTSGTTQKCEAALTGTSPVSLGYACVTPASCSAGSYLDITPYNGAVAQAVQAVPAGGGAVNLIFDANGNAPFSFSYRDSGSIYLSASKAAGGSLLSALAGTSNTFLVDPAYFTTAAAPACGSFSYSGQAFALTVTAKESSAGGTTPNYSGAAGARTVSLSDANGLATGTLSTSGTTCVGPCIDAASFSAGIATVTTPKFTFLAKATGPSTIKLRAIDAAGVSSASGTEATALIYSGRLRIFNAYGSDLLPLRIPLRAEYYTGSAWTANAADACTSIPATAVAVGNRQPAGLGSAVSSVQALGGASWSIVLGKPVLAGVADVAVNLGSGVAAATSVCLGSWSNGPDTTTAPSPDLTHLTGQWCASPALSAPLARVKFGAGRAPYIYLRERF